MEVVRSLQLYNSEETASYVFDTAVDGYSEYAELNNNTNMQAVGERIGDNYDNNKDVYHKVAVVLSNLLLFFLIFGLSATVNVTSLKRQFRNKFAVGTGIVMQFLIMPILGFFAVVALRQYGLSQAMGITLLVVTTSPGGSYSNWWCSTFNADLALSVAMTSFSTILSIAMLPANLMLYTFLAYGSGLGGTTTTADGGAEEEGQESLEMSIIHAVDFNAIFLTLGIVMSAILSGLAAGYKWDYPRFHVACNRLGSICGIALIMFSFFLSTGVGGGGREEDGDDSAPSGNFWSQPWAFYVGVAIPCFAGIVASNVIARSVNLPKPECVAISIECAYQNVGIATSVAVTMFHDPRERVEAISVPLFYGVIEAAVILFYCVGAWKMGWTKAPANEKFCKVVMNTYEVEEHPHPQRDDRRIGSKPSGESPSTFPIISHLDQHDDLEADYTENGDVLEKEKAATPAKSLSTPTTPATSTPSTSTSASSALKPRKICSSSSSITKDQKEKPWHRRILERLGFINNKKDYRASIHHDDDIKKLGSDDEESHGGKRVNRNRIISEDYTTITSTTSPSLTSSPATPDLYINSSNNHPTRNIPQIIYEENHSDLSESIRSSTKKKNKDENNNSSATTVEENKKNSSDDDSNKNDRSYMSDTMAEI